MKAPINDIIVCISGEKLKLCYSCKTSQVTYSISDTGGSIIQHGNYDCLVDSIVPIHNLSPGVYTIRIIDGDSFCSTRFRKEK